MTTPPDDFENDPTGVRDLLQSMPDPGPMPQDISDRITAALAAEQQARAAGTTHDNVAPLTRGDRPARSSSRGGNRWMRAVGGLVAAAAVAAVAVVGVNTLQNDNAPTSAVPSGGATRSASADQLAGRTRVEASGTNYSTASFNTQAASMASGDSSATPDPSMLKEFGALANPQALVQCARTIGGSLLDDPSNIKVDLATFDGKPAVIIVVTNHGKKSAFAVSSSCSKGDKPYAAPRSI